MSTTKKETTEIIIETPKGSRNKYKYDGKKKIFKLNKILPAGFAFPFDFGFIPGTKGDDGDPLDILLITHETTFPGCHVDCRIIGGIKAMQKEKSGEEVRNDRFFAVPDCDTIYDNIQGMEDLSEELVDAITNFFIAYRKYEGTSYKPVSMLTADEVKELIKEAS